MELSDVGSLLPLGSFTPYVLYTVAGVGTCILQCICFKTCGWG